MQGALPPCALEAAKGLGTGFKLPSIRHYEGGTVESKWLRVSDVTAEAV